MSSAREGGCQCGAVRYRFVGDPLVLGICHCTECQRQSGSAFGMTLMIRAESFKLLSGTLKSFVRPTDSGRKLTCFFCLECGTRIHHVPEYGPGLLNLKPGTLDDTSWLKPTVSAWMKSKQPWVAVPEGIAPVEGQP